MPAWLIPLVKELILMVAGQVTAAFVKENLVARKAIGNLEKLQKLDSNTVSPETVAAITARLAKHGVSAAMDKLAEK